MLCWLCTLCQEIAANTRQLDGFLRADSHNDNIRLCWPMTTFFKIFSIACIMYWCQQCDTTWVRLSQLLSVVCVCVCVYVCVCVCIIVCHCHCVCVCVCVSLYWMCVWLYWPMAKMVLDKVFAHFYIYFSAYFTILINNNNNNEL